MLEAVAARAKKRTVHVLIEYLHLWESISGVELQPDVDDTLIWQFSACQYSTKSAMTLMFGSFLLANTLQNLHMKLYLLELSTSHLRKESGRVGHLASANSSCG